MTLYLPTDFSAELDAHTGDGAIRNDLDVVRSDVERERRDERDESRRSLRGRLGDGGRSSASAPATARSG